MSSPFSVALTALLLGMVVVFIALGLVVVLGRLLIRITNQYAVENQPKAGQDSPSDSKWTSATVDDSVVAVLAAAVAVATNGRGRLLTASSIDKNQQDD